MTSTKLDMIGRGNPVIDFLYAGDKEILSPGGSSTTVAITLSKLGMRSGIIGRVGEDEYGRVLLAELAESGVDLSRLRVEGNTSMSRIKITDGDRIIFKSEFVEAPSLNDEDFEYIRNSRSFYARVSSISFPDVLRFCERHGVWIFASLQRLCDNHDFDRSFLYSPFIKLVFGNVDEVEDWMKDIEGKMIIITEGENGCTVYSNGKANHFDVYCVDAIDTTGAGDTFAGAFLYGFLSGWPLYRSAGLANRIGALATTKYGARTVLRPLRKDELLSYIHDVV